MYRSERARDGESISPIHPACIESPKLESLELSSMLSAQAITAILALLKETRVVISDPNVAKIVNSLTPFPKRSLDPSTRSLCFPDSFRVDTQSLQRGLPHSEKVPSSSPCSLEKRHFSLCPLHLLSFEAARADLLQVTKSERSLPADRLPMRVHLVCRKPLQKFEIARTILSRRYSRESESTAVRGRWYVE